MGFGTVSDSSVGQHDAAAPKIYVPPARYSEEQLEIIHCKAPVVVGQAFAGSGKSTTGIGIAAHNRDKRILVLCFNTANAAEAKLKYPSVSTKVTASSTHALARECLSPRQMARVSERWGAISLRHELPLVGGRNDYRTAAVTASLLKEFFMSTDERVDPVLHGKDARRSLSATDATLDQCAQYAQLLWLAMNTGDVVRGMRSEVNSVTIPHDAYLKMFVMRGGNLGYDIVIFDEAQDANPIMLRLLENQYKTGSQVVMLGDRHQSIYEFRGAINAMEILPDTAKVLSLTQSWRFGPRTADIANFILSELKGETLSIQGMGEDRPFDPNSPVTYLSRTNADLLQRAVAVNGKGVHWVGGIEGYRVSQLNDAWALRCGRLADIRDPYFKRNYPSWEEFKNAVDYDAEAKIIFSLVDTYQSQIPHIVEQLCRNAVPKGRESEATTTLTTGHRSKGLEWPQVHIADDFRDVFKQAESWLSGRGATFPLSEINLFYVLATRAQHYLRPNHEMENWFDNIDSYRRRRTRSFSAAEVAENKEAAYKRPGALVAASAFSNLRPMF